MKLSESLMTATVILVGAVGSKNLSSDRKSFGKKLEYFYILHLNIKLPEIKIWCILMKYGNK